MSLNAEDSTPPRTPKSRDLAAIGFIAVILGALALSFAYTAGWLTPNRLTPDKIVSSLAPPGGPALGHRRNHVKGFCFLGTFTADGMGSELSVAPQFARGTYPVVGRLNIGSAELDANDATSRVRGMGVQITGSDGSVWRMAMIDLPFFPVATPQAFYELQLASASHAPDAMPGFIAGHPEFEHFKVWASTAPWTGSYAEERYNSLDSFTLINAFGVRHIVRWSLIPEAHPALLTTVDREALGPDYLETEIVQRVRRGTIGWHMDVTSAERSDATADPSQPWPVDRPAIRVGELLLEEVEPEADGPCRDINYDPTVLPPGIALSDDPFPAARSAAYRRSYDLRTSEARFYPRSDEEAAR